MFCKLGRCLCNQTENLAMTVSRFSTSAVQNRKTRLDIEQIKEVQSFQRSSSALYGRIVRTPKRQTKSHKKSNSGTSEGYRCSESGLGENETSSLHTLNGEASVGSSKSMTSCLSVNSIGEQDTFGTAGTHNENFQRHAEERLNNDIISDTENMHSTELKDITYKRTKVVSPAEMDRTLKDAIESVCRFSLNGSPEHELSGFSREINKYLSGMKRNPSVGTILQETMSEDSRAVLDRWMKKMIEQLGEQGFLDYKNALFANGQNFHAYLASLLTKKYDVALKPENTPLMESIGGILDDISDVQMVESRVYHDQLGYMGVLDGVVRYKDDLVLLEWKTADKEKATLDQTFDNPIQVAAYMGALNSDFSQHVKVSKGLLVIAYRNGRPATIHPLSPQKCLYYWQFWLLRLQMYWKDKLNVE